MLFRSSHNSSEKSLKLGKDRGQKEKRASEEEMAGWHHQHNEHELGQIREMVRDMEAWRAAVDGVTESGTTGRYWSGLSLPSPKGI